MNKRTASFLFIGLISVVVVWMADKQAELSINFLNNSIDLSLPQAIIYTLLTVIIIDFLSSFIYKVYLKQIKEAFKSGVLDTKTNERYTIDKISTRISDKLVIDRKEFDQAFLLVLKSMTAITAGDMTEAKQAMKDLKTIIGNDPILDLLQMKIYKGEKDFNKMNKLSNKLMKNENVQMVGLKAAVESQMQKKDFTDALKSANKAFELRQDLYWVIESAFELRARSGDWEGALQVLQSGIQKKIIPVSKQKKFKAIVYFELAKQAKAKDDETNFVKFCTKAFDTDKTLAMAAIELAKHYKADDNQYRKAANILTTAWKKNPIDLIAYEYLNLFNDKAPKDKIARMEKFAHYNAKRPSLNNRILAEICADAGLWQKAKGEIEVFLINNPATQIICNLIARYEEEHNKDKKAAKAWKNKAKTSAEDGKWICAISNTEYYQWQAIDKKSGSVGEIRWHLYDEIENNDENNFEDDFNDDA